MESLNVLQRLKKVEVDPYPHIYIENCLPESIYLELSNSWPDFVFKDKLPDANSHESTFRVNAESVLKTAGIKNIWKDFFELHTSSSFFLRILDLFGEFFDEEKFKIPNKFLSPTSLRKSSKPFYSRVFQKPFVTDCQFVKNLPLSENETFRAPHLDNPIEIYAGLLYFKDIKDNSSGGDLSLFSLKEEKKINTLKKGDRSINPSLIKLERTYNYDSNSLVLLPNLENSFHGVTPRKKALEDRKSINSIAEFNNDNKMWNLPEET